MRSLSIALTLPNSLQKVNHALRSAGQWKYHVAFLIFVLLMSWRAVITKQIVGDMDKHLLTFVTAFFAVVFAGGIRLVVIGKTIDYNPRPVAPYFIVLGFSTLAGMAGSNAAISHMPPVLFSLIEITLYPVLVSLIASQVAKGETVHLRRLIPVLLVAFVGIGLFTFQDLTDETGSVSVVGFGWELIGVVGWATSIVMVTNIVRANVPPLDVITFRFMTTIVVLGIYLFLRGDLTFKQHLPEVLMLSLFGFVFPFIFSFAGVKKVSVITYALYTMLTPITTYLLSLWLLEDQSPLTLLQVAGALLIFGAVGFRTAHEVRNHRRNTTRLIRERVQQ